MAAIVQNAEAGVNHYATFNFIRNFTPKPCSAMESTCSAAVKVCQNDCQNEPCSAAIAAHQCRCQHELPCFA
jgi:hypothetical protein